MNARASIGLFTRATRSPTGMIPDAIKMIVLRVRFTDHPDLISRLARKPPVRLPRPANRYGTHAEAPISFMLNPRASARYFGSQITYSHHTGSTHMRASTMAHTCLYRNSWIQAGVPKLPRTSATLCPLTMYSSSEELMDLCSSGL